jgi:hypothetical protein
MKALIAIPVLLGMLIVQTAVISRMSLLYGSADLMLVFLAAWVSQERVKHVWEWAIVAAILIGFVSATPFYWWSAVYLMIAFVALYLRRRVWQMPVLLVFFLVFGGSLLEHVPVLIWQRLQGANLSVLNGLSLVTLPSVILNLVLALPVYMLVRDWANGLYPLEEE